MTSIPLEKRVEALEAELARLKAEVADGKKPADPWKEDVWGAFANDPGFLEAMRLGREYRESLRPQPRKPRKARR